MARLAEQGIYSTKGAEHLHSTVRAGHGAASPSCRTRPLCGMCQGAPKQAP